MNKIYKIDGMTCASCKNLIESEASKIQGIQSINVNFASENASLVIDSSYSEVRFENLLISLGYRISRSDNKESTRINRDLLVAIILLLLGSIFMGLMFFMKYLSQYHMIINLVELILSTIVFATFGKKYFLNLLSFVKTFRSNMNTLIGIGVITSLGYSLILFYKNPHQHLYVESIPFILGFAFLGHYFEKLAKTKATSSLSSLYQMQLKFAVKIDIEPLTLKKSESRVPVVEIKINDIIKILPGEKLPLGGTVVEGESHINESAVNGESLPRGISKDDRLIAGSLNLEGTIFIKVEDTFSNSFVSNIIDYIEKAESKKTNIEQITDKVVRLFVPIVIVLAFITFIFWKILGFETSLAVNHFIAVLVIACPCALGLAVPISVMIATRKAALSGIFINGADVLEKGSLINTIVFDKTGTLTVGEPKVSQFYLTNKSTLTERKILELLMSVCSYSNHPLSKSITQFGLDKKYELSDPDKFKNIPGLGFSSEIDGHKILVGNKKFLISEQIIDFDEQFLESKNLTGSFVHFSIDQHYSGFFHITDQIKPNAFKLIDHLLKSQYEIWILSGDNEKVTSEVALKLGIKHYKSEALPQDKVQLIKSLKDQNKNIAMVGDGINDAMAMVSADLSISMSNGSDLAISSSQITLLEGDIGKIEELLNLSKRSFRIIKENLFLSFIYNLLCIPLAAGIFIPFFGIDLDPKWASLSMGLSSTSVILSSLRLKK